MIPAILSGGSGTRLWPVSRASYPKQFCEFYDQSFLKNSIERLKPFGDPVVVTVGSMSALTEQTLKDCGLDASQVIYEPFGKNTAPAVGLLCRHLELLGKTDEIVGAFPADHLIVDEPAFREVVQLAIECAEKGDVVTLGIQPRYAATGYGYIEINDEVVATKKSPSGTELTARLVTGFSEKPDAKTAEEFRASGKHYWNAGMFLFRVSTMIEHFKEFLPDMWQKLSKIGPELEGAKTVYANISSKSIDYGIMEKLKRQVCIPCEIGWSDVGSWDEIARLADEVPELKKDVSAKIFNVDAERNYVFSIKSKVVGLIGVENLIVVDTPDGLLIAKRSETQKVKELVAKIKQEGYSEAISHPFETRPWGGYDVLSDDEEYKTKRITVDPGQRLSYQSHKRRSETWVVVTGKAKVTLDDKIHELTIGQSIQIPQGAKHRVENPEKSPLVFIEVQTGKYFGEDDIIRYEDDYNRV